MPYVELFDAINYLLLANSKGQSQGHAHLV